MAKKVTNEMIFEALNGLNERLGSIEDRVSKLEKGGKSVPSKSGKGNATASVKAEKPVKPAKVYNAFSQKGETYRAGSMASKANNPNAILFVEFTDIPNTKTRNLLKAFGFKWDRVCKHWYNANTAEAQEIFKVLK